MANFCNNNLLLRHLVFAIFLFSTMQAASAQSGFWGRGHLQEARIWHCVDACAIEARPRMSAKEARDSCHFMCVCTLEPPSSSAQVCLAKLKESQKPTPLSRQEVLAVNEVLYFLAYNAKNADITSVYNNLNQGIKNAKVLKCVYTKASESVGTLDYFWYKTVPATRAELTVIAPSHPLLALGDKALLSCPAWQEDADIVRKDPSMRRIVRH